jgi:heme/copper-type cytochrome/quinol oxidase subunit 3
MFIFFFYLPRSLNNIYFYNNSFALNNTYHSFVIRAFILSELLIFFSFFCLFYYFSSNNDLDLSSFHYFNYFSFNFFYFSSHFFILLVMLSIILLNIKLLFFQLKSSLSNNNSLFVFCDILLCLILLSLFFIFTQYHEFIFQGLSLGDNVVLVCIFSLLGIHCFHVILGGIFLLFLFLSVNYAIE